MEQRNYSTRTPVYDRDDTLKYVTHRMDVKPDKVMKNEALIESALDPNTHNVFVTCHGTIMMICDRFILPNTDDSTLCLDHGVQAYAGVDFVTISKEDARTICDMLYELASRLVDDDGSNLVSKLFPDKVVSFERLLDRLEGELYPASSIILRKKAAQETGTSGVE